MGDLSTVFITIGFIALLEGILFFAFPDYSKKLFTKLTDNTKKIRKIGFIEIIVAISLLILSLLLRI